VNNDLAPWNCIPITLIQKIHEEPNAKQWSHTTQYGNTTHAIAVFDETGKIIRVDFFIEAP
jgi:hypothetical protein